MRNLFKLFLSTLFVFTLVVSCSTKKNTMMSRNFHALTTKYNVLFNGTQAYEKGLKEIQEKHQDNFLKRLQIEPITFGKAKLDLPKFRTGDEDEDTKLTPFERAEEKAVKAVQKHSINITGYEKNRQIDDAYLLLGKARYYTQRFVPAIEAFNYIIANYPNANLVYETKIWRAKSNIRLDNERFAIESLNLLLQILDEKEQISDAVKEQAHTAMAMAYEKTDTIQKVIEHLTKASAIFKNKEQSARNMFVLGQIYSEQNKKDSARMIFKKLANLRKAPYKYRIHAKIELAKNTSSDSSSTSLIKEFKKLIKKDDNRNYLGELYYQLGALEENRDSIHNAISYYKKALQAKNSNNYQKTFMYERLGNLSFDKQDYLVAGAYYDSVLQVTSKEFENERHIRRVRRKNRGLTTLKKYEDIITNNDSIIRIASMPKEEQKEYFETYIEKLKKEDEERKQLALNSANFGTPFGRGTSLNKKNKGKWYFHNPQSIGFGKAAFQKIWGNRSLEDNWRISDKTIITDEAASEETTTVKKSQKRYELSSYLNALPKNQQTIDSLVMQRNDALYQLGLIYKERFKNNTQAIKNLSRLNNINTNNELTLPIYYHLYRAYKDDGNTEKANKYKKIVVTHYPNSRFAQVITSPNKKLGEEDISDIEMKYRQLYYLYKDNKFDEVVCEIDEVLPAIQKSKLIPKFVLLRAFSIGKYLDKETYKNALEFVVSNYANTTEGKKAQEIVNLLN